MGDSALSTLSGSDQQLVCTHLVVRGTDRQRWLAQQYFKFVTQVQFGPHVVSAEDDNYDRTILEVPAAGLHKLMGRGCVNFQKIEDRCGVMLMLSGIGQLVIYGDKNSRHEAELQIMSSLIN